VNLPNSGRLWSLSLSPDGSKLAVSDSGSNLIFVLSTNPLAVSGSFPVGSDPTTRAGALSITNEGIVYFLGSGINATHKLDTTSDTVTDVGTIMLWSPYSRMLSAGDDRYIYFNLSGGPFILDTTNDTTSTNNAISNERSLELALSGDRSTLTAAEYVMDTTLNPQSFVSLNEKQTWDETIVYGEKLNPNGTLLFRPLSDGLDVVDARTGQLLTRIALPVTLAPIYDSLVADGRDSVLILITGTNNDGISVLDLQSLPPALPLGYATHSAAGAAHAEHLSPNSNQSGRSRIALVARRPQIPYTTTSTSARPLSPH
jgi:DNA-binding beta-propeller fold protein YncE